MKKTLILVSLLFAVALLALSCAAGDRAGTRGKSVLLIPIEKGQRPQQIRDFADEEKGIYMRTLPNGLRVVIRENHTAPVVYCNAIVHTGSIHEGEFLGHGMSHILEHVVAGGTTTTRSEDEIGKLEERIGAYANAATSKDYTEYYMTVPSRYFETAVDILSDQIIRCTFDRKELEREFGVVTQEVLKGREEPGRLMWKLFDEAAYDRHPGRLPVIGYLEKFLRLNREDIIAYYRKRYVPENLVFAIAGDVDHEEAFRVVAKAFEPMDARPLAKVEFPSEPVKRGKRYVEQEANIGKAMMRMGFRTVKAKERDMYPLDLLAYIAGRGRSSALYRVLCEEKGLVQDVFAYSSTPDYVHGHFVVGCDLEPGKIEDVQKEVIAVMEKFKKPLPKETLELAAIKMVADYVLEQQDVASQGSLLAHTIMHSGDPLDIEHYIERIRKVRPADIVRVAGKYFCEDNLTVAVLKPRTSPVAGQDLPLPGAKQKKSGIVKFKLDNGLTVLLKRNPALPVVAMQTYSRGGVLYEGDKHGVSNLMVNMLLRGTKNRTAEKIFEEIESVGGRIEPIAGNNTFGMKVEVLKDDMEKGIDVLSDCLVNPMFDEQELATMKKRVLFQIQSRSGSWHSELSDLYREKFYGEFPYGRNMLGTAEKVASLKREDLAAFHGKYAVGGNTVLAVFGDIDIEKTRAMVEKYFAGMPAGQAVAPPLPPAPELKPGEQIRQVKHTRRGQVNIMLGTNGAPIGHEDRYAMGILAAILSKNAHEALRQRNDYVYVTWATSIPGFDTGTFYVLAQTTPDKYDRVMAEIHAEIGKIMEGEFSDEDLDIALCGAVTGSEIGMQTNRDVASAAALDELYGLGYDHYLEYPGRFAKVTRDDIVRVARKYFVRWLLVETRPEEN